MKGSDNVIDINWLDLGVLALITIALVNRIKSEAPNLKGFWYTIISFAIGAALYAIVLYLPEIVRNFIAIGLVASGIFDAYKKT